MPPDSPNEQELMLKKRARRRLVGAIALVLLMIIVLPQVLQDRAVLAQQDPIKIVMQEPVNVPAVDAVATMEGGTSNQVVVEPSPMPEAPAQIAPEALPQTTKTPTADTAASAKPLLLDEKPIEKKALETVAEAPLSKSKEMFTVQVGVYSDATNVKRLQEQLKQAGFLTKTEKVKTAKGETIRLKAGSYSSRQEATLALAKIKDIGLPGIVVSQ